MKKNSKMILAVGCIQKTDLIKDTNGVCRITLYPHELIFHGRGIISIRIIKDK